MDFFNHLFDPSGFASHWMCGTAWTETFENAAVSIAHKDVGGRFLRVNEKYCEIVGYTRAELLAKSFHDITHPEDLATDIEQYARLMRGELPSYLLEKRYIRKDGSVIWIDLTVSLQRDSAGRPAYAIAVLQDVSERKRLEDELRRAKEAAESANRAKDEFLANVSHEIRTPFGAILGMTELVLDTPLSDDQRQCLETVKSAADNLFGVINDLLDFAKIEAGKLELDVADFSLRTTLAVTMRALTVRAHKKGLELVCHVEPDVPEALVGDAGRLRQVLTNLVGNAIKFTEQGEVVVRVEEVGGGADHLVSGGVMSGEWSEDTTHHSTTQLRITVRDTGIGIPADKQRKIFHAFEQEDTSTTRRFGGTGLGLTIAGRLVALMGGTITVESELGRGSTFAFTGQFGQQLYSQQPTASRPLVPLANLAVLVVGDNSTNRHILQAVQDPVQAPVVPSVSPMRILVAEDNEFNVRHLERLLTRRGHSVRLAGNGRAALELAQEAAFDVLLLDLHMPEMDGFQVIQTIREQERAAGGHLPVIALTARSRKEDRERCLAAGIDEYLSKPVRAAELFAAIGRVVSDPGVARPSSPDGQEQMSLLDPATLLAACGEHGEQLCGLCEDFRVYVPARMAAATDALRDQDAPRLREAAHKLCGLLSAFSTVAGTVASDLEEFAAAGRLEECPPLVARLEAMTRELIRQVDGVSLESLCRPAATAGS